jgi:hypothetical protein
MDVLIIDLTHGGVIIALELKKMGRFNNIYAYDIYNTLRKNEQDRLDYYNVKIFNNDFDVSNYILDSKNKSNKLLVVNPVHSYFNIFDTINKDNNIINKDHVFIKEITHHQAVSLILNKWKEKINYNEISVIEVTGVKGKTSVVTMLKEILINDDPIVLSSLGAKLYKNKGNNEINLKENISITPANILKTIKSTKKINNTDCGNFYQTNKSNKWGSDLCYGACIFEVSLGVTGLGDVGVLTNIVENYSIAKNNSNAKKC